MGFINTTSLKCHIGNFRHIFTDDPTYHVIGVSETRLGLVIDDNIVQVDGYSIIKQDRNSEGGGLCLYIRSSLRATVLAHSETTGPGKRLLPEYCDLNTVNLLCFW